MGGGELCGRGLPGCRRKKAEPASLPTEGVGAVMSSQPQILPTSRAPSCGPTQLGIVETISS